MTNNNDNKITPLSQEEIKKMESHRDEESADPGQSSKEEPSPAEDLHREEDDDGEEGGVANSSIPLLEDKVISRGVLAVSLLFLLLLRSSFITSLPETQMNIYLSPFSGYFSFLMLVLLLKICTFHPSLNKYSPVLNIILVMTLGYILSEIVYRIHPIRINDEKFLFFGDREIFHLNNYFLNRLLHIIPLSLSLGIFYLYNRIGVKSFVKWGNLNADCRFLNPKDITPWNKIILKVFVLILVVLVVLLVLKSQGSPGGFSLIMLIPVILYAGWNCLVEETLFRGIFLSMFANIHSLAIAVFIQALLFGLIHYDPTSIIIYAIKVIPYTILGWFFGKATEETRGMGASFIIHFLIVLAIEIRLM